MSRVLLVDDDADVLALFGDFLRSAGYAVVTAQDAATAVKAFAQDKPDVVVADVALGKASGLDVVRQVRQADPLVPVIVITGSSTPETAAEVVRAGASDYLLKPIEKHDLMRAVAAAVRIRELDDERLRLEAANAQYHAQLEVLIDDRTKALHDANARLTAMVEGVALSLATVIENWEQGEAGHQRRVAALCRAIAREVRLPISQLMGVHLAGLARLPLLAGYAGVSRW